MNGWQDFADKVIAGVKAAALGDLAQAADAMASDASAFLQTAQADLQTWVQQLAKGSITQADFTSNVQADVALAEMAALTDAGIGAAALQRFRDTLVSTVLNAALASVPRP